MTPEDVYIVALEAFLKTSADYLDVGIPVSVREPCPDATARLGCEN
jgi:hypothetical protein